MIREVFINFAWEIIRIVVLAIVSVVAIWVGNAIEQIKIKAIALSDTKLKKDVVDSTVRMIEQLYKAGKIVGEEKFNQAVANADKLLKEKGLSYSDDELKTLIESAVQEFTNK